MERAPTGEQYFRLEGQPENIELAKTTLQKLIAKVRMLGALKFAPDIALVSQKALINRKAFSKDQRPVSVCGCPLFG